MLKSSIVFCIKLVVKYDTFVPRICHRFESEVAIILHVASRLFDMNHKHMDQTLMGEKIFNTSLIRAIQLKGFRLLTDLIFRVQRLLCIRDCVCIS